MANPDHLKLLLQSVADWNTWREERPEIMPDLSEIKLHGAYHGWLNLKPLSSMSRNIQNFPRD